jgi:hypothetical protein
VSVSASNLPAGVSANFSPNSVNSSGSVSVSFFVQSGTAAGTSNVTITGTNGTISHSVTIALTIPGTGNPSFTLTPAASTLAVTRGGSATDTVTVTGAGGFNGSVTLAASGLPTGVTAIVRHQSDHWRERTDPDGQQHSHHRYFQRKDYWNFRVTDSKH